MPRGHLFFLFRYFEWQDKIMWSDVWWLPDFKWLYSKRFPGPFNLYQSNSDLFNLVCVCLLSWLLSLIFVSWPISTLSTWKAVSTKSQQTLSSSSSSAAATTTPTEHQYYSPAVWLTPSSLQQYHSSVAWHIMSVPVTSSLVYTIIVTSTAFIYR